MNLDSATPMLKRGEEEERKTSSDPEFQSGQRSI